MKYRAPRSTSASWAARDSQNPTWRPVKARVAVVKSTKASRKQQRQNKKRGRA
jgi:hypothetical protein